MQLAKDVASSPVSYTHLDVYKRQVMTRYLARDILTKCDIHNFDDWAANFAEPVTRMEYATDGVTIKPKRCV